MTETVHDVGAFDELKEAVPVVVTIGTRDFVIVRWQGRVHALRNVCPHQLESFELGDVYGLVAGGERIGELECELDNPVITCPRHGWRFKLTDGRCVGDPTIKVRSYEVAVEGGRVLLKLQRRSTKKAAV